MDGNWHFPCGEIFTGSWQGACSPVEVEQVSLAGGVQCDAGGVQGGLGFSMDFWK